MFAWLVGAAQSGQIINRIVAFVLSFLVAAEADDLLVRGSILEEKFLRKKSDYEIRSRS